MNRINYTEAGDLPLAYACKPDGKAVNHATGVCCVPVSPRTAWTGLLRQRWLTFRKIVGTGEDLSDGLVAMLNTLYKR